MPDFGIFGRIVDGDKIKAFLKDAKSILDLNEEITKLLDELKKNKGKLIEELREVVETERKEVKEVSEEVAEGERKGVISEEIRAETKEVQEEEIKSEKVVKSEEEVLSDIEEVFEKIKSLVEEHKDFFEENIAYFERILEAAKKEKLGELGLNEKEFIERLKYITEDFVTIFKKRFKQEIEKYRELLKHLMDLSQDNSMLLTLSQGIDKLAEEIREHEKPLQEEMEKLHKIVNKSKFGIRDLIKIIEIMGKIIQIGELKPDEEKELYEKVNTEFKNKKKILIYNFGNIKIRFRIHGFQAKSVFLSQLDKEGEEMLTQYKRHREFLERLGFREHIFKDFPEEVSNLENKLIIHRRMFIEHFEVNIKHHINDPDILSELKEIAVDIMGIMTEGEFKKITGVISPREMKKFEKMISVAEQEKAYAIGGMKGFLNYTAETWEEIHKELLKHPHKSPEWNELKGIFNRGIGNFRAFLAYEDFSSKEIDERYREVLQKKRGLRMGVKT